MMKQIGYGKFITEYVNRTTPGTPIYTEDTAREVTRCFGTNTEQAKKVVNVTLKRLADQENTKLIRFGKGIYYKPKITVFGPTKLNPMQVFIESYIKKGIQIFGYETGPSLLNQLGITTQVPKYRYFATNRYQRYGDRIDTNLKVVLRRAQMNVTVQTRPYLQLLDALENKDKTPIDIENANERLSGFAIQNNLDFQKLIAYAKKYYNKQVVWQVAELAVSMENELT
jgi:hypothetical protein